MDFRLFSIRTLFVVFVPAILFAGCALNSGESAGLPDDGPPVPVSQDAAVRFAQKTMGATAQTESGDVMRFTVTQEEATSALWIGSLLFSSSREKPDFQGIPALEGIKDVQDLNKILESQSNDVLDGSEIPPQILDLLRNLNKERGEGLDIPDIRLKLEDPQVYFKGNGRIILRGVGHFLRWRLSMRVVIAPRASRGELVLDFVEGQIGSLPMPEFVFDPMGSLLSRVLLSGREYAEIIELKVEAGTLTFAGRLSP